MSKTSGEKVSINEVPYNLGKYDKELNPPQESLSKDRLQKSDLISTIVPILILILVSFSVYFNALSGDFVYDDTLQIVTNPWIKDIRNIPNLFYTDVWSFGSSGVVISNYYRPLMHAVYTLNYYLFGLNPWGFHLINILLHCGVTVLVFMIIQEATFWASAVSYP